MKIPRLQGLVCLFAFACTANVSASFIASPLEVINNTLGEFDGYSVDRIIDQSGLSAGFISGVTDLDSYIGTNPTHASTSTGPTVSYVSPLGTTSGIIDFDLGSVISLSDFILWGDDSTTPASRGPRDFNLFASLSADFTGIVNLGSFTSASPPIPEDIPAEVFSFANANARYLRLEILNSHGDSNNINIGEIAVGVSAAPIPPALWLFGSGLLGLLGFSRRKKAASR